jgi:hypothetical protein
LNDCDLELVPVVRLHNETIGARQNARIPKLLNAGDSIGEMVRKSDNPSTVPPGFDFQNRGQELRHFSRIHRRPHGLRACDDKRIQRDRKPLARRLLWKLN